MLSSNPGSTASDLQSVHSLNKFAPPSLSFLICYVWITIPCKMTAEVMN
jgi:hypothetical protein